MNSTGIEFDELLKLIRYFSNYFTGKLKDIKDTSCRGFFQTKIFKDELTNVWNRGSFGDENGKLCGGKFVETTFKLFEMLDNHDFLGKNLHLDKENNIIFTFLANVLCRDFKVDNIVFSAEQKDKLRIVHSKMSEIFVTNSSKYLDEFLNNKLKRMNLNNNVDSEAFNLAKNDKDFIKIKRNYNKRIRYQNHIDNFKIHLSNQPLTTHSSLFYHRFPWPMIRDDDDYIKKYYDIIEDTQKKIMELNVDYFEEKIAKIDQDINVIKAELLLKDKWDVEVNNGNEEFIPVEDVIKECSNIEQKNLKEFLRKSKYKTERCEAKRLDKDYFNKRSRRESNGSVNSSVVSSSAFSDSGSNSSRGSILKNSRDGHKRNKNKSYNNYSSNDRRSRDRSSNSRNFRRVRFSADRR